MKAKDIPIGIRKQVEERDSFDGCCCCIWCGKPHPNGGIHLHHVKRRSQGGEHRPENLVSLCYDCHMRIHNGDKEIQTFCEEYLRSKYEQSFADRKID